MVSAEDQYIIRMVLLNKRHILIDGIGCSPVPLSAFPFLIGRQYKNASVGYVQIPGGSASDIGIQFKRLILCKDTDCINTAVCAVAQGKIDDSVFTAVRNSRLGNIFCQNTKAASLSSGQKHCNTGFLS